MKSLHTRLDPKKEQVLKFVDAFGPIKAMDKFDVASYDRFAQWLKEVTGDADYGLHPKISLSSHQTLGDQLTEAFLRKVSYLETENERLRQRNEFLEWGLGHKKDPELTGALAILEVCEV